MIRMDFLVASIASIKCVHDQQRDFARVVRAYKHMSNDLAA